MVVLLEYILTSMNISDYIVQLYYKLDGSHRASQAILYNKNNLKNYEFEKGSRD